MGHAIFDAAGRCVRTLERDVAREAGLHLVAWDGREDEGRAVAAGVYFQHLRTATASASQRVVRLR